MHAVRCGSSRLELQRLPDRAREWIPGGRVPLQGPGLYENRLAELAAVTARTALDRAGFASPRGLRLAVLLGLPDEVGRPGHSFPGPDREPVTPEEQSRLDENQKVACPGCGNKLRP